MTETSTTEPGEHLSSLPLAWDRDRLVVTDKGLLKRLDRPRLSASTSKSVMSCGARWVADKAMPGIEDPFAATDLGTAAHAVLEKLFQQVPRNRTKAVAARTIVELAGKIDFGLAENPTTMMSKARWMALVEEYYSGIWSLENPRHVHVQSTELALDDVEVAGVPFTGFIDRIDFIQDDDGGLGLKVLDYKSGKIPILKFGDDHGDQMRLYVAAIAEAFERRPVQAVLYYTRHGRARQAKLANTQMNATLRKFEKSWVELKSSVAESSFQARSSVLCGWCPLVACCPVAERDGVNEIRLEGINDRLRLKVIAPLDVALPGEDIRRPDDIIPPDAIWPPPDDVPEASRPATSRIGNEENLDLAAAGDDHQPDLITREDIIETRTAAMAEESPWEATLPDGSLNFNSYAARACAGYVTHATSTLRAHGQRITPANIHALAATFALVVSKVQNSMTGRSSLSDGLNSRLRGFLYECVELAAPPFGEDDDAWKGWANRTAKGMRVMANEMVALFENENEDAPWAPLSGTPAAVAPAPEPDTADQVADAA